MELKCSKWSIAEMEAIFDLQLSSWILPRYVPLNAVIVNKRFVEEFKVNLVASCKLIVRCKSSLVRLIRCSNDIIEKSEYNLRQIVHHVDNWISNLDTFVEDILKEIDFKISKELNEKIEETREIVKKWNTKLIPRWNDKWEILSSGCSSEAESD